MKKKTILIPMIVLFLTLATIGTLIFSSKFSATKSTSTVATESVKTYSDMVSDFKKISVEELVVKQNTDDIFVLYVGRESCPYCSAFVPKLYTANKNTDAIYYLDTEVKTDALVEYLKSYKIESVPYLAKFKGQETVNELAIPDNLTVKDIKEFLKN